MFRSPILHTTVVHVLGNKFKDPPCSYDCMKQCMDVLYSLQQSSSHQLRKARIFSHTDHMLCCPVYSVLKHAACSIPILIRVSTWLIEQVIIKCFYKVATTVVSHCGLVDIAINYSIYKKKPLKLALYSTSHKKWR